MNASKPRPTDAAADRGTTRTGCAALRYRAGARRALAGSAAVLLLWLTSLPALADWPPAPRLERPAQDTVTLLPSSISARPRGRGLWDVTFRFRPQQPAKRVNLAGSFNGWSAQAEPLTGPDADGFWTVTTVLGPGRYQYKFVLDGRRWVPDPLNPQKAPDNFGGFNSVLVLGKLAAMSKSDASLGDGRISALGCYHDPARTLYFQTLGPRQALVRFRTLAHDVQRVWLVVRDGPRVAMHVTLRGPLFDTWEARVTLPPAVAEGNLQYTFVMQDAEARGCCPEDYRAALAPQRVFDAPDWALDAIWYQIMPDRFRNGCKANDPDPVRPWTSEWFSPSPWEQASGQSFYEYYVFHRLYGGDIQGIEQKLDYLKSLGVNAIYLNPIFQAPSHHKYNACSYLHVDEHLGQVGDYQRISAAEDLLDPGTWQWTASDRIFLDFLKKAHAAGIRVIIDGVFNHVGRCHPAFQDVLKRGRQSPYADWFDVISWEPLKYRGWAGHDSLPVFKKSADGFASETLKQHIFNVTRRWMDPDGDGDPSDGIDGWRLDVPNLVPAPFWVEWRQLVKSINPQAYITGEIWDRADLWLDGRHFDAVMNYEFARAVVAWAFNRKRKITVSELDRKLAELRLAYPSKANYVVQNLLDSHDTDRLVSMALNPDRAYDAMNRVQDDNPDYDNSKPGPAEYRRARLAVLLQMTYVGAPMIYYGDEVGMWGADDPTNRKPMLWEDLQPYEKPEENHVVTDHLAFYRQVIALRNGHSALRRGDFQTLLVDDESDVWAYLRADRHERIIVVLNGSDRDRTVRLAPPEQAAAAGWHVLLGPADAVSATGRQLTVRVPHVAGVVIGQRIAD